MVLEAHCLPSSEKLLLDGFMSLSTKIGWFHVEVKLFYFVHAKSKLKILLNSHAVWLKMSGSNVGESLTQSDMYLCQ